jgi:hypothetical protein
MYQDEIESLIKYALLDGALSTKEREILIKKATKSGIDQDEFEMVLDARLYELNLDAKENLKKEKSANYSENKKAIKCPNCQASIDSFATSCEYCGYNVVSRQSSGSIRRLFILLTEAEQQRKKDPSDMFSSIGKVFSASFSQITGPSKVDRKKMEIISSFPVSTTKEDILEFLSLAFPKAKLVGNLFTRNSDKNRLHNQYALVWKNECEQIIMKAKFSMQDDQETLKQVLHYAKELDL